MAGTRFFLSEKPSENKLEIKKVAIAGDIDFLLSPEPAAVTEEYVICAYRRDDECHVGVFTIYGCFVKDLFFSTRPFHYTNYPDYPPKFAVFQIIPSPHLDYFGTFYLGYEVPNENQGDTMGMFLKIWDKKTFKCVSTFKISEEHNAINPATIFIRDTSQFFYGFNCKNSPGLSFAHRLPNEMIGGINHKGVGIGNIALEAISYVSFDDLTEKRLPRVPQARIIFSPTGSQACLYFLENTIADNTFNLLELKKTNIKGRLPFFFHRVKTVVLESGCVIMELHWSAYNYLFALVKLHNQQFQVKVLNVLDFTEVAVANFDHFPNLKFTPSGRMLNFTLHGIQTVEFIYTSQQNELIKKIQTDLKGQLPDGICAEIAKYAYDPQMFAKAAVKPLKPRVSAETSKRFGKS